MVTAIYLVPFKSFIKIILTNMYSVARIIYNNRTYNIYNLIHLWLEHAEGRNIWLEPALKLYNFENIIYIHFQDAPNDFTGYPKKIANSFNYYICNLRKYVISYKN